MSADADCAALIETAGADDEAPALVMFDIDYFKKVNDEHGGHETGDEAPSELQNSRKLA